jgi:hypothetical protein
MRAGGSLYKKEQEDVKVWRPHVPVPRGFRHIYRIELTDRCKAMFIGKGDGVGK